MGDTVTWERTERIGLVEINNPPVNAAAQSVRAGLVAALDALEPDVDVIALFGAGRTFVAGADIREFGKPPQDPWLPAVCARIEGCSVPVIAVLHGAALGGGLELAMAAHVRVALGGTKLGLPEATLGILPGAGGTQRAPRLIGLATALDLIVSGKPIGAARALQLGLIDRVVAGPPRTAAIAAAEATLEGTLTPRTTGALEVSADDAAVTAKRAEVVARTPHLFAPSRCIEAVAAATQPLAEGLKTERALFDACMQSPQRAGLMHAFFAERAVAKIPETETPARPVARVGVVGAGTMGQGIAAACLIAGLDVTLMETSPQTRALAADKLEALLKGAEARGKLQDAAQTVQNLTLADTLEAMADRDLVIEAVPEELTLKQRVFASLEATCGPDVLLASNTSYLDLDAIAAGLRYPGRFLGLHFFAPAHVMRLLEVVVTAQTVPNAVATGFALAKRMGKVAVRAGVCDGFIGNRILSATRRAADEAVLLGADPAHIDAALEASGFAMGPYAAQDLSGLDIGAAGRAVRAEQALVADALIARGHLGRKTGVGFYDYGTQLPTPNPDLAPILDAARKTAALTGSVPNAAEITARYLSAMVAEGCRCVEDGIALRAIDVDAVLLFGYGFPRHLGGPMHWAETQGLAKVIAQMETYAHTNSALWSVPDLLRRRAAQGQPLID